MPQPTGSNVQSVAGFWTDTFTQSDPLLASECISQGVKINGGLGVLKRGTVLFGPLVGVPITTVTPLTTVPTGATARAILAQDVDTSSGQVAGLVYTQGKFLDTGMIFTSNGAASDAAQLWQFGIYVLTVLQASGKLVPMVSLPATGGPLAASMTSEEAAKANQEQIDAIKAAIDVFQPGVEEVPIGRRGQDPAWATAAFGEREPSKEETALDKANDHDIELRRKHQKAIEELQAKQAKELHELHRKQHEERAKGNGPTPPAPKKS
jgi:hypothetical protein